MMKCLLPTVVVLFMFVSYGCDRDSSQGTASSKNPRAHQPAVDLKGIPTAWQPQVGDILCVISLPKGNRYYAIEEEVEGWIFLEDLIFTVYEDGPDMAHRVETYRLESNGRLYRLNMSAENRHDTWVLISN
ncbi:MAG: hypothetical protein GVY30_01070 [Chloroflexi bacterium]|jgi:hypothetical protein|nr:hypothetical protein [Chloroflexota bacterium]